MTKAGGNSLAMAPWVPIALSPLLTTAGFVSGWAVLVPVLSTAPAYYSMVCLLGKGRRGKAIGAMLVWSLLLGVTLTFLSAAMPDRAHRVVLHGPAYWEEMSAWIETGEGRENHPSQFLPQHLLHVGIFVALSLATASMLSILFGAVLMGYMSYYVAQVVLMTPGHPIAAGFLAWHPWSIIRIVSFVILGVVLAEPLVGWLRGRRAGTEASWHWIAWIALAAGGLLLDVLLKSLLAPHWPALLRLLR